jgi:CubicO group peptidase (beta-lactamase class C family)
MFSKSWSCYVALLVVCGLVPGVAGAQVGGKSRVDPRQVGAVLDGALKSGSIVGAQLSIGGTTGPVLSTSYGKISPTAIETVNEHTLFCIGSSSKPVASAIILRLVGNGKLEMDRPVSQWMAAFEPTPLTDLGGSTRAPTVRELLAHRGGIYSQKGRISKAQQRAIRDFTQTLEQSVGVIVKQPLIAPPGTKYAYSGAGYCVLGRVAELATHKPFEQLLQENVCQPLGLERTTYFPPKDDGNVALPAVMQRGETVVQRNAPHLLGGDLRLALIGGSVHSTADELGEFARMMLNQGRHGKDRVLAQQTWNELSKQQFPNQGYGLGWNLEIRNRKTARMMHTGSLFGYRSMILVDLERRFYLVALWTLADSNSTKDTLVGQLRGAAGHAAGSAE